MQKTCSTETKKVQVLTVQRHGASNLDRHEVHHPLGVEVLLTDTKLFHNNIGEPGVRRGDCSDIGGCTQNPDLYLGGGGQERSLTRATSIVGDEGIVVKNNTSQRMRKFVRGGREEAVLQETGQCVALPGTLTATDEDARGSSNVVMHNIAGGLGVANASEEAELWEDLVLCGSEASGACAGCLGQDGGVLDLVDLILFVASVLKECLPACDLLRFCHISTEENR